MPRKLASVRSILQEGPASIENAASITIVTSAEEMLTAVEEEAEHIELQNHLDLAESKTFGRVQFKTFRVRFHYPLYSDIRHKAHILSDSVRTYNICDSLCRALLPYGCKQHMGPMLSTFCPEPRNNNTRASIHA